MTIKSLEYILSNPDSTKVQLSPSAQETLDLPKLTTVGEVRKANDKLNRPKAKQAKMVRPPDSNMEL